MNTITFEFNQFKNQLLETKEDLEDWKAGRETSNELPWKCFTVICKLGLVLAAGSSLRFSVITFQALNGQRSILAYKIMNIAALTLLIRYTYGIIQSLERKIFNEFHSESYTSESSTTDKISVSTTKTHYYKQRIGDREYLITAHRKLTTDGVENKDTFEIYLNTSPDESNRGWVAYEKLSKDSVTLLKDMNEFSTATLSQMHPILAGEPNTQLKPPTELLQENA